MKKLQKTSLVLRLALAFSFIYAAISSFITPQNWVGFLPEFLPGNFITYGFYLLGFSVYEFLLGVWLISNKKLYYASIISAITLALITILNLAQLDIVFRDVSLFLTAVALVILTKE